MLEPGLSMESGSAWTDEHAAAARQAHERLFDGLPAATAYQLSADGSSMLGLPRVSPSLDLTYGDVPFDALAGALRHAALQRGGYFYDLGSGVARGVLCAALLCGEAHCIGIELLQGLHDAACEPVRRFRALQRTGALQPTAGDADAAAHALSASNLAASVDLRCGDLFSLDLRHPPAGGVDVVVFVCCVTWSAPILERLAVKLSDELADGARVLTVGKRLPEFVDLGVARGGARFDEAWRGVATFEWGCEPLVLQRVVHVGELTARRLRKKQLRTARSLPT